jgi:hypothetical protein
LLESDADLVRETAGTRIAVVDGQVIDISSRRIELQPHRIGLLTLGPLQADGVVSNSVSIDITEAHTLAWTPGENDVRLTQIISEPNPWLQQQTVLDIELRTRHPISDEVAKLPVFEGFRVVPVFTERRTLEEAEGWAKTAWRYLLFPQRSGNLTIPGASFSGVLLKSRAERGAFELVASPTPITVRPSAFGQSNWWVAASSLTLTDSWSGDPTKLSAGDEVGREITVAATGVLPEQIPDISMDETRGLSITPLGVTREGKIAGDQAQASATFRFRLRAMSPVPVFLDTVRLRWWDTVQNRAAEAIIPARRIDIGIPDRDALVANALSEQSWRNQLLAQISTFSGLAYAALVFSLALMVLPAFALWRSPGVRYWLHARRTGRDLAALAGRGDVAVFHERLRGLARAKTWESQAIAPVLHALERALFARNPTKPDLPLLALQAAQALHRTKPSTGGSSLPPL